MKNPTKMSSAAMVQPIIKFFKTFSLKPKVVPSHADLFLILRCNSFLALHLLPSFPSCISASVEERVAKYVNINFLRRYLSLLPYIYQCHLIICKILHFNILKISNMKIITINNILITIKNPFYPIFTLLPVMEILFIFQ